MIALATAATVIASQAVITGAFSLTNQAVQLGLLPRLQIRRTSETQAGQIYIPRIRGLLLVGTILLVVLFQSSNGLASAYGVAVAGTMLVDGVMAFIVVWRVWKWALWAALALMVPFILIDFAFFGSNLLKVPHGGWVPLLIGASLLVLMLTWHRGARILAAKTRRLETPLDLLLKSLAKSKPPRVPGTAVFLTAAPESAPTALLHSLKHYKVLHESNVILTIVTENIPRVCPAGPGGDGTAGRRVHARDPAFRLHGDAQHSQGARHRAEARLDLRHHVDLVLPVAALGQAGCAIGHAGMAGQALHLPRAKRRRCVELFPAAHRPRGRDRHAGHCVREE